MGLLLSVSMLLLTSCVTQKEIEYRYVVPEMDWPEFPEFNREDLIFDYDSEMVSIPFEEFVQLAAYKNLIKATEDGYNRLRELANEL